MYLRVHGAGQRAPSRTYSCPEMEYTNLQKHLETLKNILLKFALCFALALFYLNGFQIISSHFKKIQVQNIR